MVFQNSEFVREKTINFNNTNRNCYELFHSWWQITLECYSYKQRVQIIKFYCRNQWSRNITCITWFLSSHSLIQFFYDKSWSCRSWKYQVISENMQTDLIFSWEYAFRGFVKNLRGTNFYLCLEGQFPG